MDMAFPTLKMVHNNFLDDSPKTALLGENMRQSVEEWTK